jgi:hypothetical protein
MSSDNESMVVPHSNSYLDESFYNKISTGGSKVNRPVTVKAIDVWWIFNYPQGTEFLTKLSRSENVNFLTAATSKTIIDYMWQHYSTRILLYCLIPYVIYFGLFLLLILFNERYFSESVAEDFNFEGGEQ